MLDLKFAPSFNGWWNKFEIIKSSNYNKTTWGIIYTGEKMFSIINPVANTIIQTTNPPCLFFNPFDVRNRKTFMINKLDMYC